MKVRSARDRGTWDKVGPVPCVDGSLVARVLLTCVQGWSAVGVDGPLTASLCQNEVVADLRHRRPSMDQIIRIGMDTSVRRETGKE
jgi:hypothetical protein